jgi:hypothetical protein
MRFFKSPTVREWQRDVHHLRSTTSSRARVRHHARRHRVFPVEVQTVYQKYKDSFAGRQIIPLNKVQ